jgi:hypothetical protein
MLPPLWCHCVRFVVGEHFFGTVTISAREPYAARYSYTNALAVRLLRYMAPQVAAMVAPGSDQPLLRCRDRLQEDPLVGVMVH